MVDPIGLAPGQAGTFETLHAIHPGHFPRRLRSPSVMPDMGEHVRIVHRAPVIDNATFQFRREAGRKPRTLGGRRRRLPSHP